jgi:predicted PurR-regulated permease PerM
MNLANRTPACDLAAWLLAGLALVLVLKFHLLASLFSGLLVFELVHVLVPALRLSELAGKRAKLVAVALLTLVVMGLLTLGSLWVLALLRNGSDNLPQLVATLAEIIEESRALLPPLVEEHIPLNLEAMQAAVASWLRSHAGELRVVGQETLRTLAHMLIGMVIGAMLALREALPSRHDERPLAKALLERIDRFGASFRRVVFAQIRIAGLNAFLTWLYLGVALPLLGLHLPYTKTLILITFLAGLLPVVGNLISNTVIVTVSLSQSLGLALGSLAFLVVIHKLEYFLNAHIIGSRIRAAAWELLLAMLIMESVFGLRGLIAAPIYYAYLKDELKGRGLV